MKQNIQIKWRLLFLFSASSMIGFAQTNPYFNYSKENLKVGSTYLQDSVKLHFHLPETFSSSNDDVKYPLIIIFDSQHEKTYPHLVNSLDMLTSESQMPESIIVGIPFTRQNRYYLTSDQKNPGDSLTGIERMRLFLFNELIPLLKKRYKANDFTTLIGHSRTAFLVNFLLTKESDHIDVAIAASGFYDNNPLGSERIKAFISNYNSTHPVHYYFTAGTATEEQIYRTECKMLVHYLEANDINNNFNWKYIETHSANHMTNYWMSVPPIIAMAFSPYNAILNSWFETKLQDDAIEDPTEIFKKDLQMASEQFGFQVNPSLTQIFSIASAYGGKNDIKSASEMIELGLSYYPGYEELIESLNDYTQK